jgi:hypothetical protein
MFSLFFSIEVDQFSSLFLSSKPLLSSLAFFLFYFRIFKFRFHEGSSQKFKLLLLKIRSLRNWLGHMLWFWNTQISATQTSLDVPGCSSSYVKCNWVSDPAVGLSYGISIKVSDPKVRPTPADHSSFSVTPPQCCFADGLKSTSIDFWVRRSNNCSSKMWYGFLHYSNFEVGYETSSSSK